MRHCFVMLVLLLPFQAHASLEPAEPSLEDMADWSEAVEIERLAARGGLPGYDSRAGRWHLAPDGRVVVMPSGRSGAASPTAALGRFRVDGDWLQVELDRHATNLASLSQEERAQFDAWLAEAAADAAIHHAGDLGDTPAAVPGDEDASAGAAADAALDAGRNERLEALSRPRFLRVPYRGGELLVREMFLTMAANAWDGSEPLELMAEAWRLPRGVEPPEDGYTFAIHDPLRAGLPIDLAKLLRVEPVVARVTEVVENLESLQWTHQSAKLHLRLDGGESIGLYTGTTMRGLPPEEELYGEIVSAGHDTALLELELERFSPRDTPRLPMPGIRFATRVEPGACGLDTSAAVRGKVRSVATPPELVRWDDEGYAWFELEIDQGAAQGLMVGDELDAEAGGADGEGRVLSVASDRATVLWRAQRYDEDEPMRLPAAGDALVTPAWRRAEWDVFGAKDDAPVEL